MTITVTFSTRYVYDSKDITDEISEMEEAPGIMRDYTDQNANFEKVIEIAKTNAENDFKQDQHDRINLIEIFAQDVTIEE